MKNLLLLKSLKHWMGHSFKENYGSMKGFTLIELMVVVLIIGVLSAIAAPTWESFTTGQRIKSVNTQILQAIKTTQAEAKRSKSDYTLQFNTAQDPPKYSIYKDGTLDPDKQWQSLSLDGAIKENMLKIYSQADGTVKNTITFDYLGTVKDPALNQTTPPVNTDAFSVVVYPKDSPDFRNCIIVQTILGTMRTAEGTDSETGCPTPP